MADRGREMKRMMLHKATRIVFALALCSLIGSSLSIAAEFSADFVVQTPDEEDMTGKIFVKGDKVRHEMKAEGEEQTMIVRPDKGVTWMIMTEEKMYMEIPYQSDNQAFEEWTAEKESKAKLVGEETVSGIQCKKYESDEDGEKTYFWVSKKYPFPLKVQDSASTLEYKNIKEDKIPDSQFELPAGLKKMPMSPMAEDE